MPFCLGHSARPKPNTFYIGGVLSTTSTAQAFTMEAQVCASLAFKGTVAWEWFLAHCILSRIERKDRKFFSCCANIYGVPEWISSYSFCSVFHRIFDVILYIFETERLDIFTSKDVLKPDVLQQGVLKTWRFVNLMFCKPDVL